MGYSNCRAQLEISAVLCLVNYLLVIIVLRSISASLMVGHAVAGICQQRQGNKPKNTRRDGDVKCRRLMFTVKVICLGGSGYRRTTVMFSMFAVFGSWKEMRAGPYQSCSSFCLSTTLQYNSLCVILVGPFPPFSCTENNSNELIRVQASNFRHPVIVCFWKTFFFF